MLTRMVDVMDNGTIYTIPFNKEFHDIMNMNNYSDIKSTVICVIIILNVTMNSLVWTSNYLQIYLT